MRWAPTPSTAGLHVRLRWQQWREAPLASRREKKYLEHIPAGLAVRYECRRSEPRTVHGHIALVMQI